VALVRRRVELTQPDPWQNYDWRLKFAAVRLSTTPISAYNALGIDHYANCLLIE
jgi:hypothetical protein